ncbi:hypothetical protein F4778DRAFT_221271 [Xylariomycetidae sp. FL2044]|nr:hypothetical protein F4778DRAFT_221271 [Xylariomycetidae sp. FL2044]
MRPPHKQGVQVHWTRIPSTRSSSRTTYHLLLIAPSVGVESVAALEEDGVALEKTPEKDIPFPGRGSLDNSKPTISARAWPTTAVIGRLFRTPIGHGFSSVSPSLVPWPELQTAEGPTPLQSPHTTSLAQFYPARSPSSSFITLSGQVIYRSRGHQVLPGRMPGNRGRACHLMVRGSSDHPKVWFTATSPIPSLTKKRPRPGLPLFFHARAKVNTDWRHAQPCVSLHREPMSRSTTYIPILSEG